MDSSAKVTSKGQVTIPKHVREALDLREGDELCFIEQSRAVIAKTPDFLALAGSVPVPAESAAHPGMRSCAPPGLNARGGGAEFVP